MKENIITRTIKTSTATVLKVDRDTRTVSEEKLAIDSKYDTPEKAMSFFLKHDHMVCDVLAVDVEEMLVGMRETDFLANGTIYAERNKENRGMVSKVIKCKSSVCMVVTPDRKVVTSEFATTDEKKIRKACDECGYKFVMVEKENVEEKLVCMDVDKFIKLSKPCKDRFSLVK